MSLTSADAARRCTEDPDFAQAVLDGTEHYPDVRTALLADIAEAEADDDEVQGYLNPQPLPPRTEFQSGGYPELRPQLSFQLWNSMGFSNTQKLFGSGGSA